MEHTESERERIEELAEEFLQRQRHGERPTIDEYAARYPELADEIRELFPALRLIERLRPDATEAPAEEVGGLALGVTPKSLGDYRILREIGHGGMGTVYEAEQQSLGRRVALKVLANHLLVNEKQRKRFEREARAAARLHHTNIVPVFGIGQHDGTYYYVMQLIRGQGLDEVLIEVQRLRDCGGSPQGEKRIDNTVHPLDEPTAGFGLGLSSRAEPARQVALTLVTGQFEERQLLDSAGAPSGDARTPGDQAMPGAAPAEPASSNRGDEDRPDPHPALSSSSWSLVDANRSGSWSKSRGMYYRSVARLGVQAADALQYAREQGVLHRDVKPANLMLDVQGTLWVTDFGLAKADDQQSLTQTGDIVGTLRYMAPEMFSGRADARSDVCALGLTLYEMLALRPAFDETDRGRLVRQVMSQPAPRLETLDRHLPRDLVTIIHKAIDREPATRYQSAAELRDDLRRFLADEPIKAHPVPWAARFGRWCKRNPAIALLTGTVATLLLVGAIVSGAAAYRFRTLAQELGEKKTEAEDARDVARDAQEEALRHLRQAYLSQARASRWSGRSGQRLDSLDALAKAAELAPRLGLGDEQKMELRNEAIACLALVDLRVVKQWDCPTDPNRFAVDFFRDFKSYAEFDGEAHIVTRRVADRNEITRLPCAGTPLSLRLSPDGRWLAANSTQGDACQLAVWDLASREAVLSVPNRGEAWNAAFSRDGRRLATEAADGSIQVYDLDRGKEWTRITPTSKPAQIRFRPDGQRLGVSSTIGQTVEVWDLNTGRILQTLRHPQKVMGIGWRQDGKLLAAACWDFRVYVWDADLGSLQRVFEGHKSVVHRVDFHPTQNLLVSHAWDGTTRVWNLADGTQLVSVEGAYLRFDREGRYLAFANNRQLGLWQMAVNAECQMLCGNSALAEDIHVVAFSPNGRLLASESTIGPGVRLWDLATFREVALVPTGPSMAVGFHPRRKCAGSGERRRAPDRPASSRSWKNAGLAGHEGNGLRRDHPGRTLGRYGKLYG